MLPRSVLSIALALLLASPGLAQIDLNNLANYANQAVPDYITKDNTPEDNRITDAGATLGRVLFYDKELSTHGTVACANCHQQEHAFSDLAPQSEGIDGALTARHSMRLVNIRFGEDTNFRWDETASTLEAQMIIPIEKEMEMGYSGENGNPGLNDLIAKLQETDYYPQLFRRAFGDEQITEERMARSMAQFVRSIQSFDTKYDAGRAQVDNESDDFPNFTADENAGKRLFMDDFEWVEDEITVDGVPGTPGGTFAAAHRTSGGLNCAACHGGPEFDIVPDSLNNGFVRASPPGPAAPLDLNVTRSPTLRDMIKEDGDTLNGGMFHSGLADNINLIMAHYDFRQLEPDNDNMDPRMTKDGLPQWLDVSVQERQQLNAFLRTLTGSNLYTDIKWSDPFDEDGNLQLIGFALAGDYNNDGVVDAVDYIVWRNSQGSTTELAADGDGSATVDDGDFEVWRANYGATASGDDPITVPEPTALGLIAAITLLTAVPTRRAR